MNDDGVGISIPHNDQPTDVPNEAPAIDEVVDNESTTLDINAPDSINQNPEEQLESNIPEGPIQPAQMTNPYSSSNSLLDSAKLSRGQNLTVEPWGVVIAVEK